MAEAESGEQVGRRELLANIRRLTIAVLDNLEEGSRDDPRPGTEAFAQQHWIATVETLEEYSEG